MTSSIRARATSLLLSILLSSVLASLLASGASADDKPGEAGNQAADAAFQAGRDLLKAGRVEEACARFEESERLAASSGTMANLGNCNEKLGHTASALHDYQEALRLAQSENRPKRVEQAQQLIDEVKPKLAMIVVKLPKTVIASDVALSLDGKLVTDLASPIPLDPGPHAIEVRSAPYEVWRTKVIPGGPGSSLDVEIGPLTPVGQAVAGTGEPTPDGGLASGGQAAEGSDPGHGCAG